MICSVVAATRNVAEDGESVSKSRFMAVVTKLFQPNRSARVKLNGSACLRTS